MAEGPSSVPRRVLSAIALALGSGLLLRAIARDLPWIETTLAELGSAVPESLHPAGNPAAAAIVLLATLVAVLALGMFLLSRRTATGFGMLTAVILAWALFPYAEIPWTGVLGGPTGQTHTAPTSVWVLSTLLVVLVTIEVSFRAREQLLAHLESLGLDVFPGSATREHIKAANRRWLVASTVLGCAIVGAFALLNPVAFGLGLSLDLLWAPALAGLLSGLALWWWSRR